LKAAWPKLYPPLVEHLKLQVRMNTKNKAVELRSSKHTTDPGAVQKGEDFVKAFSLGFDVEDVSVGENSPSTFGTVIKLSRIIPYRAITDSPVT
jgi:rRNA processing protein Krr1/Pno1